jgi:hypothetical protein
MEEKHPIAHTKLSIQLVATLNVREMNVKYSLLLPSTLLHWVYFIRMTVHNNDAL